MIKPVNGHLLVEPLKQKTFLGGGEGTYEEIGIVLEIGEGINWKGDESVPTLVSKGDKVYFDSWLCAKYPAKEKGEFLWLVRWQDVRAVEEQVQPVDNSEKCEHHQNSSEITGCSSCAVLAMKNGHF